MIVPRKKSFTGAESLMSINILNNEKTEVMKKRVSMSTVEEALLQNSQNQLQDGMTSMYYPTFPSCLKECFGIDDIIVTPSYMEFKDGCEGITMEQVLTLQNIGNKSAMIRIKEPNSLTFKINTITKTAYRLCPGLSLSRVVSYTFKRPSSLHAMIPIEINGTTMDFHMICTMSTSRITAEPTVLDFGSADLSSVSDIQEVTITNVGGKSTRFCVDLGKSETKINVHPMKGIVKPNSVVSLAVQVIGKYEGKFRGDFWIKSNPNIHISVKINIIEPRIIVRYPNTMHGYSLFNFPKTFLETQRSINFSLQNFSSQVTRFVILDKTWRSIEEIDIKEHPTFDAFKIDPLQGTLQPFEEIMITITFSPTVNNLESLHKQRRDKSIDYFIQMIRICKIEATEAKDILNVVPISERTTDKRLSEIYISDCFSKECAEHNELPYNDETGFKEATVYLHGDVEIARLYFVPDNLLLGDLGVGDIVQRLICVKNPSKHLPLTFSFVPKSRVRCQPQQARLEPNRGVDVIVTIEVQFNLEPLFKLEFDVWAEGTDGNGDTKIRNIKIARVFVQCIYNPLKASGQVTHANRLCRAASFDNLPLEPDYSYTYSPSELVIQQNNRSYWSYYFRSNCSSKTETTKGVQEMQCSDKFREFSRNIKTLKINDTYKMLKKSIQQYMEFKIFQTDEKSLRMQLLPLQMYKINVSPTIINYGMVALHTTSYRQLVFKNNNKFRVLIFLISLQTKNISFPDGNVFILQPESTLVCSVKFLAEYIGRYNSYLYYVINSNQKYQLPITANVICKRLSFKTKEVIFDKDYLPQEGYRIPVGVIEIVNDLNTNTKFKWTLPVHSNFVIDPESGEVAGDHRLCVAVYQEVDPTKSNRAEASALAESGARAYVKVEAAPAQMRAPSVILANASANLGEVPLNVARRLCAVLCNAEYFGVGYEVDDRALPRGVEVSPLRGAIPPRGIVIIRIYLKFDTCMEFSTFISIVVQKSLTLQFKLSCTVIFPKIQFKPSTIEMKRICSNSYRVREIVATNLTNAVVNLQFVLQDYPEFRISYSPCKNDDGIADFSIVQILPLETITLYLHFAPCDLASYSFYLPMVINELIGPVSKTDHTFESSKFFQTHGIYYAYDKGITVSPIPTKLPTILINCTVCCPVICINKLLFEFHRDFIQDELKICNNSKEEISFSISIECFKCAIINNPFVINWSGGTEPKFLDDSIECLLLPNDEVCFKLKFEPKEPGYTIYELPIYLENGTDDSMYNKIVLRGSHLIQRIESEVLEIYFIPIPLKVRTVERINLQVHNFKKSTFVLAKICSPKTCSGKFDEENLKIIFPEGASIYPNCSHTIPVEIQFKSFVPVSFCTKVIFSDIEESSSVLIYIYGTADSSLLSIHIYEKTLNTNFLMTKEERFPYELTLPNECAESISAKQNVASDSRTSSFSSNVSGLSKNQDMMEQERHYSSDSRRLSNVYKIEVTSNVDHINSSTESTTLPKSFYPFYPLYTNSEKQKIHMHRTSNAVNMWLYASVQRYQYNPRLIDGITVALSGIIPSKIVSNTDKNKTYPVPCTLIDILKYLTNSNDISEIDKLLKENSFENDNERVNNVVNIYQKVVEYLLSQGACVAHVLPELLLNYNDYELFQKLQANTDYLMSELVFQSRSKQCWLDLMLQCYKCFVISKINEQALESHVTLMNNVKDIDSRAQVYDLDFIHIISRAKENDRRSKSEKILLAWLECLNTKVFSYRPIKDFEDCLSDGLVFIAATIVYCPFLKDCFFNDIYLTPNNLEEKLHNTVCLVEAWKKIRLGFIVTPSEIVNRNCIQMLMLTVHLFQNLPTYLIRNKVVFNCPLTETVSRQIKLNVESSHQINYIVQFFENDIDIFSSKPIVSIFPGRKQQIKVTYHARKLLKAKAYLVLCGSAIGFHFVENQTFILEGFPDDLHISGEYTIRSKLYQIAEKKLNIAIPYNYQTHYEIWLSDERPNNPDDLKISRWADLKQTKTPKRLLFRKDMLTVGGATSTEAANLAITITCMVPESRSFWVILRSELADFIIQINSNYQPSITDGALIEVPKVDCICTNLKQLNGDCQLNKKFFIPTRNNPLQRCLLQTYRKSLFAQEESFWLKHLDNYVGLRLIRWMVKEAADSITNEFKHAFNSSLTYNVAVDKNNVHLHPRCIKIEDHKMYDDKIELTIHVPADKLTDVLITLTSSDKKEIRICKLDFLYEESSTISSEPQQKNKKYQINNKSKSKLI